MKQPTNSEKRPGIGYADPNALSWEVYDRLPHAIREVLWGSTVSINPISVRDILREADQDETIRCLLGSIYHELQTFDREHEQRHGYRLPAMAARVVPLRYLSETKPAKPSRKRHEIIRRRRRHR